MAIKDWTDRGVGNFTNKKNGHFIWIFEKDFSNDFFRVVVFANPQKDLVRRKFKTKTQALSFAKSYMRSH